MLTVLETDCWIYVNLLCTFCVYGNYHNINNFNFKKDNIRSILSANIIMPM